MWKQLSWIQTKETNPYRNLALEEQLLLQCEPEECILYLWQNRNTVVIGRNQNCWRECNVSNLEADGGFLARRLSGGGAVYHDLGNLNFTFLARKKNYDVDRQLAVILRAMELLGLKAEKTGRNDVTIDGRKFSGNAFYQTGDHCYHHGTLLVNTDGEKMARYLNVSSSKLKSKGVASVRSRVVNLAELLPAGQETEEMIADICECLHRSFAEVYGMKVEEWNPARLDPAAFAAGEARFASREWKYDTSFPFEHGLEERFSWGEIQIQMAVQEGRVMQAKVYSDAMDPEWASVLEQALTGTRYERQALMLAVEALPESVRNDICQLLEAQI
ncbi:lipoate--protein ligase [Hominifimenecus sp. rT4P-3]|uniref:lipoate--protein ligase n=1 Tax=Hominifimenecus sp. rT4P-3 TaxID=3242979 RepID=UPI003DA3863E